MNKYFKLICMAALIMLFGAFIGCDDEEVITVDENAVLGFRPLPEEVDTKYSFIWITDIHMGAADTPLSPRYETQENRDIYATFDAINDEYIPEYEPGFVTITGDLIDYVPYLDLDYYRNSDTDILDTFQETLEELELPFYCCLGNHDFYGEWLAANLDKKDIMLQIWNENFYDMVPYYSFEYSGIKHVFMNSYTNMDNGDYAESLIHFASAQIEWFLSEMEDARNNNMKCLLFFHHPLTDEVDIYSDIADNSDVIMAAFTGHTHNFGYREVGDVPLYINSSVTTHDDDSIVVVEIDVQNYTISFPNAEELGVTW